MSHFEIVIPDEQQMTQISAAEARQVFAELMSGAEIRYVQTTPPATPAAPEPTVMPAVPPQPVPATVPVPVPEPEAVTSQPPAEVLPPAAPAPKPDIVSEPETEQASAEQTPELILSNKDQELSQSIIERNEGTVVFETPEAAAVKAASPSPEVKAAMQSAVNDMEAQLSTLRDEVKKLRQTLQGKEKLLALKSEPRLHSLPQAPAAGTDAQPATAITPPTSKPVPVELETAVESGEDKDPGLLRILVEILTLGAAGAFIGYFLAYRRKQKVTADEELAPTSRFNPFSIFSRKESEEEEEYIYEEEDDEEEPAPKPKHILEEDGRKHEIQVDEEAYDDSIDFTRPEMPEAPAVSQQTEGRADEPEADDINPDYILQEANLSIAFGDLTAAYEALFKLVNRFPQNTAYRLAMLRALKGLSREEEFIYHANHLAKLTGQDPDSEWQQALQWGHEFLPEHPLFESVQADTTATEPTADTERKTLDDAAAKAQSTVVMDTRKALAEYEQKLRAHEEAKLSGRLPLAAEPTEDEDDMDKTQAREIITLDLGEDAAQVNSPFKLDLQHPHAGTEADSTPGLSADDDKTRAVYEEAKSHSISHDEELTAVVHDHAPTAAEENMLDLNELMDDDASSTSPAEQPDDAQQTHSERELADRDAGHIIEFDHEPVEPQPQISATDTAAGQPAAGPAPSDFDDLSPEALASMAEFGMVEGIQIDEDILKRLHESEHDKGDSAPEESDDVDDPAFVKRD